MSGPQVKTCGETSGVSPTGDDADRGSASPAHIADPTTCRPEVDDAAKADSCRRPPINDEAIAAVVQSGSVPLRAVDADESLGVALSRHLVTSARMFEKVRELIALIEGADAHGDGTADPAHEASGEMIETWRAAQRFSIPQDTLRHWCRTEGIGQKIGGRWAVDVKKLQAKLARG